MPTNAHTYAARKAAKRCVFDGNEAQPGHAMCAGCLEKQRTYRDAQLSPAERERRALRRRMREANLRLLQAAPATPHTPPLLLCCGTWWQITHIPLPVPCCGRVWLEDRPSCGTGVD